MGMGGNHSLQSTSCEHGRRLTTPVHISPHQNGKWHTKNVPDGAIDSEQEDPDGVEREFGVVRDDESTANQQ